MPFIFHINDIFGMISSNYQLESLDWDIIATGHSHFGNRIQMITQQIP